MTLLGFQLACRLVAEDLAGGDVSLTSSCVTLVLFDEATQDRDADTVSRLDDCV